MEIRLRKIESSDVGWIKDVFTRRWGGEFIVSRGKIHRPEELEGFIGEVGDKKKGLVTFKIINKEMEIVSLDSFLERKGIGTKLVEKIINSAKRKKLRRIWLVTTNDNINALRFWQERGFTIKAVYSNAISVSRKLKPGIPHIGNYGIPIKDEIELELKTN